MTHSVAIISFSQIHSDSRVLRQIATLSPFYCVHTIGYGSFPAGSSSHLRLQQQNSLLLKAIGALLLLFRVYPLFYRLWFKEGEIRSYLANQKIRTIILNDVTSWPLASLRLDTKAILDAHEFSPSEHSEDFLWRTFIAPFKLWCSSYATQGTSRFCVEPNLCHLWEQHTKASFHYLPNASPYSEPPIEPARHSHELRIVHHGIAHPSRRIELMIEAISFAGPEFTGFFILAGRQKSYLKYLRSLASLSRCSVLPPVNQDQLVRIGSCYDAAIISVYPSNINNRYCLPNKFFQCIQSRIPIVCGPTPSMASIVKSYDIGVVSEDFTAKSLAVALRQLTPSRISQFRMNLDRAARDLCWEQSQSIILEAVHNVAVASS